MCVRVCVCVCVCVRVCVRVCVCADKLTPKPGALPEYDVAVDQMQSIEKVSRQHCQQYCHFCLLADSPTKMDATLHLHT